MAFTNWFEHTFKRRPWRTQRQAIALITLSFFVAIIIGALYLAQAANVSTTGRQLEDLILQRNQLEQSNEQIRAEIARLQSVPRLRDRARELGFVDVSVNSIEYLPVLGYNPRREERPAVFIQQPEANVLIYDETFLGWLQQQWDAFTNQQPAISEEQP
jgi:cell division protein FtsB